MEYEPQELEATWRQRWAEEGRYEADPSDDEDSEARSASDKSSSAERRSADSHAAKPRDDDEQSRDKTFITVPYPYPSGGMHIGHCRTYTVPDVYARYRRLQGDNVLFPIAWHVTGTPIIGAVERLKKGEEDQLSVLQDTYNVPKDTLEELETPMGYARYFIENHYKQGMRQLGLSIDWRREFTTNDERYSQFITWQYQTLKERGLLERGLHPVKYCTEEENPVTTHDLLEGEEAEFQEYTLVKFQAELDGEAVIAPMATLRPETVRGVTNAYVNPEGEYVRAQVDNEGWVVSEAAVEKLRLQDRDVEVVDTLTGDELVGKTVTNPITGDEVLILPATFVDTENATGVVMSVPAHSPDDYLALQEAKADEDRMAEYGIDPDQVAAIEPIPILDIEGYGDVPAKSAVEEAGIDSSEDPELEDVTADLYQDEFHSGVMHDDYGEFAGKTVDEVREEFRAHYQGSGEFDEMHEFTEEVVCRCGGAVEVAKQDTWFLRYNDADWKAKAHEAVSNLTAIPENTREQYDHTIDWLNEWPCIRNYGLGTRLPWDDEFVIEPLSDSTIYMAYYTIAHRLQEIPVEDLDRDFFDALFYGPEAVDDPDERALELREEWDHWYPIDFRCSANDLIQNHLTFFLFHHAELFDPDNWPEGITIMGMGLLEGQKMSSSKGHVVLPSKAIEQFGADTVRFFLLNSAEPWQDYDWRADAVSSTRDQLERFWARAQEVIDDDIEEMVEITLEVEGEETTAMEVDEAARPDLEHVDRWLLSKLQGTIRDATDAIEGFETRTASQAIFYNFEEHLKWYRRRADLSRDGAKWTLREVLRTRLRLLSPFVPFMANELHEQLTGEPAEAADWPAVNPEFEDEQTEREEQLIERLTDDVHDIVDVTGTDPDTIRVYTAADWKRDVFETVRETGTNVGQVMGEVMQDPDLREKGDAVNDLVQDLVELVRERDDDELRALSEIDELAVYDEAESFLEREFDATVEVYAEDGDDLTDPEGKADSAVPFRPAIHLA